jgi:hypothetical protein|tara:strand:- start:2484 stop:2663 length:180 start_codon:yes stop_codon:yes gene_type:complete
MVYEFNYKDNEGDEYPSGEYSTKAEAKKAWEEVKKFHNGDCHITETWIYNDEGEFVGRY